MLHGVMRRLCGVVGASGSAAVASAGGSRGPVRNASGCSPPAVEHLPSHVVRTCHRRGHRRDQEHLQTIWPPPQRSPGCAEVLCGAVHLTRLLRAHPACSRRLRSHASALRSQGATEAGIPTRFRRRQRRRWRFPTGPWAELEDG
eukprot:CAMPEP_0185201038 /NCGR_PEP_ID=MMETSP1140-20130426/48478_1 /TAXON_ID=298111 /ORGANISM="Pavlova sp., Strain CCMP459" /LENGTH=144 /DNA_ID=CAMNT_0027768413 /DNA_START=70 /DNA_END=504 /DNA_ORIENTATION=-